jgi:hypothetical protein
LNLYDEGTKQQIYLNLTKIMNVKQFFTTLAFTAGSIVSFTRVAYADTYLVIANNTDGEMFLNTSYPIPPGTARWNPLDATIDAEGITYNIRDTHEQCSDGGWRISTDMSQGGTHLRTHDYCIPLAFAEVGCLGVRIDQGGNFAINKVGGLHCSNQWWDDQQGLEVFQTVVEGTGNAIGAFAP